MTMLTVIKILESILGLIVRALKSHTLAFDFVLLALVRMKRFENHWIRHFTLAIGLCM